MWPKVYSSLFPATHPALQIYSQHFSHQYLIVLVGLAN